MLFAVSQCDYRPPRKGRIREVPNSLGDCVACDIAWRFEGAAANRWSITPAVS